MKSLLGGYLSLREELKMLFLWWEENTAWRESQTLSSNTYLLFLQLISGVGYRQIPLSYWLTFTEYLLHAGQDAQPFTQLCSLAPHRHTLELVPLLSLFIATAAEAWERLCKWSVEHTLKWYGSSPQQAPSFPGSNLYCTMHKMHWIITFWFKKCSFMHM